MLKRSKQAPLTIYAHWETPLHGDSPLVLKSLAREIHRVRHIDTTIPSELFSQLGLYTTLSPLGMRSIIASYKRSLEASPSPIPLEWAENAELKQLALKDFPVDNIHSLLMPSMTSLSLSLSKHDWVPGDELIESLRPMESLQSLKLHSVIQDIAVLPVHPNKQPLVRMPRLQTVALSSFSNGLAELQLLSSIAIPPHVDFSFVIHNSITTETREIIWTHIMDNIIKDARLPFHSIFIFAYGGGNFLFTARSPAPEGSLRESTLFQVSLHFPVVADAEGWLTRLCTTLPCTKVRTLSVGNLILFSVDAWESAFRSLNDIESLEVTGLACATLPEALLLSSTVKSKSGESKPIFPNLRQLTVWLNPMARGETVAGRVERLCRSLQDRKDKGFQLEQLILRGHPRLSEEYESMLDVVGRLTW